MASFSAGGFSSSWIDALKGLAAIAVVIAASRVLVRPALKFIAVHGSRAIEVAPVRARAVVDPTGCGDAYRAGFAHGLARGRSLGICARLGSVMGALLVEKHGTQSLTLAPGEMEAHYERAYGERLA